MKIDYIYTIYKLKYLRILIYSTLIFLLLNINSCKKDIDVNAKWKDITVVYGLLNQNDTAHYVRISKAFLGEGNANVMARKTDSTDYPIEIMDVKLEEWSNNAFVRDYQMTPRTVDKEKGVFGDSLDPKQIVYKTKAKLSTDKKYILKITNLKTGKIIKGETELINDFFITKPVTKVSFVGQIESEWYSAKNGRTYQVSIRFYFDEIDKKTLVFTPRYIDWSLSTHTVSSLNGNTKMTALIPREGFYMNVASQLEVNKKIARKPGKIHFIVWVASDDYNTYLEMSKPSNTIVQEKPIFTNIDNGIGIFSCRYNKVRELTLSRYDSLVNGRYTKKLGFFEPGMPIPTE
ncbi:MAG: DUF4249 family protein [Bacteroidales bacterium]|nr:DUF4249 family protein [Bacteroidales bacterium]